MQIANPNTIGNQIDIPENTTLVSTTDVSGKIIEANHDLLKFSGYSKEEVIGKNHNIMRHSEMPDAVFKEMWATILSGDPWNGVIKNKVKSGNYYWAYMTVTPIFDSNGKRIGFTAIRIRPTEEQVAAAIRRYKDKKGAKFDIQWILNPTKFLQRYRIKTKLLFILILMAIALGSFSLKIILDINEEYFNSISRLEGSEYNLKLAELMRLTAKHRGLVGRFLGGESVVLPKITEIENEMNARYKEFEILNDAAGNKFQAFEKGKSIISGWENLRDNNRNLTYRESFSRHVKLIRLILDLDSSVGVASGLFLDSGKDTHFMVDASVSKLQNLAESLGQLRAYIVPLLVKGESIPNSDKLKIKELLGYAGGSFENLSKNFEYIVQFNPDEKDFASGYDDTALKINKITTLISAEIIDTNRPKIKSGEFFDPITECIDSVFALNQKVASSLARKLKVKAEQSKKDGFIVTTSVISILGLLILFQVLTIKSILDVIRDSTNKIRQIVRGGGELKENLDYGINDEIGGLLKWMGVFILNFTEIVFLLRQVTGKLTIKSKDVAELVKKYSNAAQDQAASSEETSAATEELTASVENVLGSLTVESGHLKEIGTVVVQFRSAMKDVEDAMQDMKRLTEEFSTQATSGMLSSRKTSESIHEVNQKASRIDEVVDIINEISERTNLLALNAAIEAARAGAMGKGFAVVAQEITKLADQTAQNTRSILSLTLETKKAIANSVQMVEETESSFSQLLNNISRIRDAANLVGDAKEKQSHDADKIVNSIQMIVDNSHQILDAANQERIAATEISKSLQVIAAGTQTIADSSLTLLENSNDVEQIGENLQQVINTYKF
ncbi:PAS domain S-box protein [Leptospira fainei serovar Hurstbridge str. BUT 6]|uniref:PAS domain S-box protein n=1 Tax=Leptospira fainei serovar Hurstbridge str. BUT 6 TaxID=1193011 RepID=S3W434_9LEPT|nr:methyl-accepting chemotaxis protein [Leptospira fainei]EPG75037.1 PAS domain S-box protein [Leptospira fainei serovar Hurstbridge str. BUT 6]